MKTSNINIQIGLDENKVPQTINWNATDSTADEMQPAKATMLSFWDSTEKTALRIDLWTQDMMIDEMADFYYQTLMGMADSFTRATQQQELAEEMKEFARGFYKKFRATQLKQ